MARKKTSIRNGKQLVELLDQTPVPSIEMLREIEAFACLKVLDLSKPSTFDRKSIVEALLNVSPEDILIANLEATRILSITGLRAKTLLEQAYDKFEFDDHPELASFDPSSLHVQGLIWVRRYAPEHFDQMERVYLTYHFHGHKKFTGFNIAEGEQQALEWTEEVEAQLRDAVVEVLALGGAEREECELIHFEMTEDNDGTPRTLHYVVVYHPGKMRTLRQMLDQRRNLMTYIPALEATVVYDPAANRVHVLSERKQVAKKLAQEFATRALDKSLSEEPVDAAIYDLSVLKTPIDLKNQAQVRGAVIEKAWVSELSVTLGHSRHSITLKLGELDDVWAVSAQHLGQADPIERCRSVLEAKLSFVVRFDGEEKSVPLDITVASDGSASVLTLSEPRLRRCAEEILTALGMMKRVEPAPVATDKSLFLAELRLIDLMIDDIDGYLLEHIGLPPVSELLDRGLITQKDFGDEISVEVEDDDGNIVLQRLKVVQESTRSYAIDEETGEQYQNLGEADLRRYQINRGYLLERVHGLLRDQLAIQPLRLDESAPWYLGDLDVGEKPLPLHLASGLWHAKQVLKMDSEVRAQKLGVGVTLTTSEDHHPTFLGPSLVIPIQRLLDPTVNDVRLDLSALEGELRRWRRRAESAASPRLLKESASMAQLIGPWPAPWILTTIEMVAAVEVLVKAWEAGTRKCTTEQVLAGFEGARTVRERFRKDPNWTTYIRGADGNVRPRLWELNIGRDEHRINQPAQSGVREVAVGLEDAEEVS